MSNEDEFTAERWTYAGRRVSSKGAKPVHEWLDEAGTGLIYGDGATVIGGVYEVEVKRDGDDVRARIKGATYAGEKVDPDEVARFEMLDTDARTSIARLAAERKHGRNSELDEALAPLIRIVKKCRTRHEVYTLASVVSTKITEAWWTR